MNNLFKINFQRDFGSQAVDGMVRRSQRQEFEYPPQTYQHPSLQNPVGNAPLLEGELHWNIDERGSKNKISMNGQFEKIIGQPQTKEPRGKDCVPQQ